MNNLSYLNIYIPSCYSNDTITLSKDKKFIINDKGDILYGLHNFSNKMEIFYDTTIEKINSPTSNKKNAKRMTSSTKKNNYRISWKLNTCKLRENIDKMHLDCYMMNSIKDIFDNIFLKNDEHNNLEQVIENYELDLQKINKLSDIFNIKNKTIKNILNVCNSKNKLCKNTLNINGIIFKINDDTNTYLYRLLDIKNNSSKSKTNLICVSGKKEHICINILHKLGMNYIKLDNKNIKNYKTNVTLNITSDICVCTYEMLFRTLNKNNDEIDLFFKNKWNRIIFDYDEKYTNEHIFYQKIEKLKCNFKWIVLKSHNNNDELSSNEKSLNEKTLHNLYDNILKHTNLKNKIVSSIKKTLLYEYSAPIIKKHVSLQFSEIESLEYSKYLDNVHSTNNEIYLQKLCCYPDKFYDFDNIILKTVTPSQYKLITNLSHKQKQQPLQKTYILNAIEKYTTIQNEQNSETYPEYSCPICMEDINPNNFGITSCGHIYCYSCINDIFNNNLQNNSCFEYCPQCRENLALNNIFKINSINVELDVEEYTNNYLIDKIGTKLTFILRYCYNLLQQNKNNNNICYNNNVCCNNKLLVFSQFYGFIDKINNVLTNFHVNNLMGHGNAEHQYLTTNKFNEQNEGESRILLMHSIYNDDKLLFYNVNNVLFTEPIYNKKYNKKYNYKKNNKNINYYEQKIINKIISEDTNNINIIKLFMDDTIEKDMLKIK